MNRKKKSFQIKAAPKSKKKVARLNETFQIAPNLYNFCWLLNENSHQNASTADASERCWRVCAWRCPTVLEREPLQSHVPALDANRDRSPRLRLLLLLLERSNLLVQSRDLLAVPLRQKHFHYSSRQRTGPVVDTNPPYQSINQSRTSIAPFKTRGGPYLADVGVLLPLGPIDVVLGGGPRNPGPEAPPGIAGPQRTSVGNGFDMSAGDRRGSPRSPIEGAPDALTLRR